MITIDEITIMQIQKMLQQKELSITELVEEYLKRIALYDQGDGKLNSILEINPDVLSIARDLEGHSSEYTDKLYGVPILLKDNMDTADGMHTSAGSLALADSIAARDADIVKELRKKGAVILGKTNMTEFANYMTKGMKAGYSSRGGEVKSPYKKNHDPAGSSTGSAVAVTANLCTAAMGTDTAGSIISPGKSNGLVGFRPTTGVLSQKGIIPISFTLDTAGPLTRTVMDSAIIYSELINRAIDMRAVDSNHITIGVDFSSFGNLTEEEGKKAQSVIAELEKSGAIIKKLNIPQIQKENLDILKRYEFKYCINKYLGQLKKDFAIHSLRDIIEFNNQNSDKTLKYGQTYLLDAEENTRGDLSETIYTSLLLERENTITEIRNLLSNFDVCLMFKENLLLQYVGLPSLTIPIGLYNDGTPNGIILTTLTDANLLKYAFTIEKVIGHRKIPMLEEEHLK